MDSIGKALNVAARVSRGYGTVSCMLLLMGFLQRPVLGSQIALVRAEAPELLDASSVSTFAGVVEARSVPINPPSEITCVIITDGLTQNDLDLLKSGMSALYGSVRASHRLTFTILSAGQIQSTTVVKSRAQVQSVLQKLSSQTLVPSGEMDLYESVAGTAAQLGSEWASVLFAGRFPPLAPEMEPYAGTYLSKRFRDQRVRVSYWTPDSARSGPMDAVSAGTGGAWVGAEIPAYARFLLQEPQAFAEYAWEDPPISQGFHLYHSRLLNSAGTVIAEFSSAATAAGELPSLVRYAELRERVRAIETYLLQPKSLEVDAQIQSELALALEINPRDSAALRLGAEFFKRSGSHQTVADYLALVVEIEPGNAALLAELGHTQLLAVDSAGAEKSLLRSRELAPGNALVAEDLARIQMGRQNYQQALLFLEESLQSDSKNQGVWFLRAEAATGIGDWRRAAASFERGLELGGVHLTERTTLIRMYLDHDEKENALKHVMEVADILPPDASVRSTYAGFLEELSRPKEALALWRRTLDVDPNLEPAHFGVTHLLLEAGDSTGALQAAETGLKAEPGSSRLHMAKSQAQEMLGLWYEARRTLQRAVASLNDVRLLRRAAETEDLFGQPAAESYARLAEAMAKSSTASPDYISTLERGLIVSLRDEVPGKAEWFASMLAQNGRQDGLSWLAAGREKTESGVMVPGGLKALMFAARGNENTPPGRFFAEYCRTVLNHVSGRTDKEKEESEYIEAISHHFKQVLALQAFGKRIENRVTITVSPKDKRSRQTAQKVLSLLGWKMRSTRKGISLEAAEKGSAARRQQTAIALSIDEVAMQAALQSGQPFSFDVSDEWAPILLDEPVWRKEFYPGENLTGGFAHALARNHRLAGLYLGFTALDEPTAAALIRSTSLKTLGEKFAAVLRSYAPALAVENGRVTVPGGERASSLWERMLGVSPGNPPEFFQALLKKDDGKTLAFFFTLAQLDREHQRFFTESASRLKKFYECFKDSPELDRGAGKLSRHSTFTDFFGDVPLDGEGHVRFPGSPEVWMVAKGQSGSEARTARLLKKLSKTAAPEVEDDILLRLARTRYSTQNEERSELDNFLGVSRLDSHRSEMLDEAAALRLAQEFASNEHIWPHFAILTGLGEREFGQFFALARKLQQYSGVELNAIMGPLHALLELLCIARQAGRIEEQQSTKLFVLLCDSFSKATSPAEFTAAALEVARSLLHAAAGDKQTADPDEAMRHLLLGPPNPISFEFNGSHHEIDGVRTRHSNYQRILELQKVTSLRTLFNLYDSVQGLIRGHGSMEEQISRLEADSQRLLSVEIPRTLNAEGQVKDDLQSFQPKKVNETIGKLRRDAAKRKVNHKDIQKHAIELLECIQPQLKVALAGIVYAYYMNADDLLVSEDPLFLRKHQFVKLNAQIKSPTVFTAPDLIRGEKVGSYLQGGFASFPVLAGRITLVSARQADPKTERFVAAQLGSLRATRWDLLKDEDLRLLGLRVRGAREWIVLASLRPELRADLADSTMGLLSLTRRGNLLHALESRDWQTVWDSVTLSDLYFLSQELERRYATVPWPSPLIEALRIFSTRYNGGRLHWLGPVIQPIFDCSHPHLLRLAPYEQYEKFLLPERLAARVGEFKLHLAEYFDRTALPASALGAVAEPLALEISRETRLADLRDWASVVASFSKLNDELLKSVLPIP